MNKCHKTIKNKLSKNTFRIPKLSKILRELKTLGVELYLFRNNDQIELRSPSLTLNKDYIKVMSIEKDFLDRTRNKYKIHGSNLPERKMIYSIISESEDFLDRRFVFWSQI